jgi:hypothetical protein
MRLPGTDAAKVEGNTGEEKPRIDSRDGCSERDYATTLGVNRLRIPRTQLRSFLPRCIQLLERRSPEVAELIRQAFLQGISMRQVGRAAPIVTVYNSAAWESLRRLCDSKRLSSLIIAFYLTNDGGLP